MIHTNARTDTSLDLLVCSNVDNILTLASSDHLVAVELADDLDWWFGILLVDELVALFCNSRLDRCTIHTILLEFLAEFELDLRVLERRLCCDNVAAIILDAYFDGRRCGGSHLAGDKANTCEVGVWFFSSRSAQQVVRFQTY